MKEGYRDGVKQRCIDPGHQVFKVFADSFELKTSESWEDGVCWRQWTSAFPVGERPRRFEYNSEKFEVGRHSQASDGLPRVKSTRKREYASGEGGLRSKEVLEAQGMRWNSIREFADEAQIRLRTHREELDRSNKTTQAEDGSTPEIVRASLRPIVAIAILLNRRG